MTRNQILENAVQQLLAQQRAVEQVRQPSGWTNVETRIAFADFLFDQNDLSQLIADLQDESIDHLAEAVAYDFKMAGCDGAFNLRKLVLSRVDWKQLAAQLLEWAGVAAEGRTP